MTLHNNAPLTLDKYADQLYFGMLSFHPDNVIIDFLKRFFPAVLKPVNNTGGWNSYPPGVIQTPEFYNVTHSYVFDSHPYFNGRFKSGQLAFSQKIHTDEKWNGGIADMKLWFEYDNEEDAKESFSQLMNIFSSFNVLKRITSQQGIDKAEFTDKDSDKYYSQIQIYLSIDYSLGRRTACHMEDGLKFTTEAGYRLVIEFGNDIYR